MSRITNYIILFCTMYFLTLNAEKHEWWKKQAREGNLLLPTSQRVAPFFGFGQLIVEENDFLVYQEFDTHLAIRNGRKTDVVSGTDILYGLDDRHVLLIVIPAYLYNKKNYRRSNGGFGPIVSS